ncbi:glycosyltransferase family 9 protein [Alcanivorax sp. DP30]|uniref:glycosyltransferase family 9 protein n=1 Tax=Alcanivorax sp. DP30 TaxID=2606217 RepID=UPI00136D2A37|nr:glycosyltransferase family 9 protein [Alcanivorax sp. DP30]MZR62538.1 glycosyltransferase family 9 protein [Alcanivorax sp. DP30]
MSRHLILFPCSHMGNLLIALPHLKAMLDAHPQALLVTNIRYRELVEQSLPEEERLLFYPEPALAASQPLLRRAISYLGFVRALRRFSAEVVVDIEGEQKSATLTRLSGAPKRIGPPRRHGRWFYNVLCETNWSAHRWLGYASLSQPAAQAPASYLPLTTSDAGEEEMRQATVSLPAGPRVLIHAGATKTYKMWHPEQFASLCQRLRRMDCIPILIGAGRKDRAQIDRVQSFLCEPVSDLCDQLSLSAMVALMKSSQGYVGNDSGPMHLAAACGLPTVALFGPTDDTLWAPLCDTARVLRWQACNPACERNSCALDSYPCLQSITVDQILDQLAELGVLPEPTIIPIHRARF